MDYNNHCDAHARYHLNSNKRLKFWPMDRYLNQRWIWIVWGDQHVYGGLNDPESPSAAFLDYQGLLTRIWGDSSGRLSICLGPLSRTGNLPWSQYTLCISVRGSCSRCHQMTPCIPLCSRLSIDRKSRLCSYPRSELSNLWIPIGIEICFPLIIFFEKRVDKII